MDAHLQCASLFSITQRIICYNSKVNYIKCEVIHMEQELKDKYFEALESVIDPELDIDLVNLGLIYDVSGSVEGVIDVKMTLTSMGCPAAPQLMEEVRQALLAFEEVSTVNVELVWTPAWSKDMMTRYGKIALGIHE